MSSLQVAVWHLLLKWLRKWILFDALLRCVPLARVAANSRSLSVRRRCDMGLTANRMTVAAACSVLNHVSTFRLWLVD